MNESLKWAVSDIMTSLKKLDSKIDLSAASAKIDEIANLQTNAWVGEIMSTANTGFWAEIAKTITYSDQIYDFAVKSQNSLLSMLPASHWDGLAWTVNAPIIGELGDFDTATQTTGAYTMFSELNKGKALPTDKTAIVIKGFEKQVAVTKQELFRAYGMWGVNGLFNYILERINLSMLKTIEAYIINADPITTETPVWDANVNFFDTDNSVVIPANALYLWGNKGIRKIGIDAGIVGWNVALDRDTILRKMMEKVADFLDDAKNLLWITSGQGANAIWGLPEYSTKEVFTFATNETAWFIKWPEGLSAYVSSRFPTWTAGAVWVSGKIEVGWAAANNFYSAALIHKYAVQYWFGMPMQIVAHETAQNIMIDVYFEFGAETISSKAWLGQTVAVWVWQK